MEKKYQYKIFRDGQYLGTLPNTMVTSDFGYIQEINTGSTEVIIEVDLNLETGRLPNEPITDESGNSLTTEDGVPLLTESAEDIIGTKDSGALIANDNDILIYEIDSNSPNGTLAFGGYISRINPAFGAGKETATITCISYGKDLIDYVFGNSAFSLRVSQTTADDFLSMTSSTYYFAENFTTDIGQTDVARMTFRLQQDNNRTYTAQLWNSRADALVGTSPLGTVVLNVSANASPADYNFDFTTAVSVTASTSYFITIHPDTGVNAGDTTSYGNVYISDFGGYASGQLYYSSSLATLAGSDIYFKIYSGTILTNAVFTSYDPSNMIRDAINGYQAQGGTVTYTGSSIDNTSISTNFNFILATILTIIKQARDLAPADWYWYVDPATNVLYFKETLTVATHRLIVGRHIESLEFEASVEEIRNVAYFTGGPTGGVNLLKLYTNPNSLPTDRRGLELLNNNRVTDVNVAHALASSFLDEHNGEVFRTQVDINANTYDIRLFKLGDTACFENLGNFAEQIIFQITKIKRNRDSVTLTMGPLPIRSQNYIDDIKLGLDKQQTLDNPSSPS